MTGFNAHGESPPRIMKAAIRHERFPHPCPLPQTGEGDKVSLRDVHFAEENHCRPVTPTSQAERDSPQCGPSPIFSFPNQVREFKR
jgi:hypothetical protein